MPQYNNEEVRYIFFFKKNKIIILFIYSDQRVNLFRLVVDPYELQVMRNGPKRVNILN